jgi:uncharacterized membrane protein
MAFTGQMHPLLIHFPIALVIVAAAAEVAAIVTGSERWRVVADGNLRTAAIFAVIAAVAGWRLAAAAGMDPTPLLEWHRWLGTVGAGATVAAALATSRRRSALGVRTYWMALFGAAALVAVAGHLGGRLVWGV